MGRLNGNTWIPDIILSAKPISPSQSKPKKLHRTGGQSFTTSCVSSSPTATMALVWSPAKDCSSLAALQIQLQPWCLPPEQLPCSHVASTPSVFIGNTSTEVPAGQGDAERLYRHQHPHQHRSFWWDGHDVQGYNTFLILNLNWSSLCCTTAKYFSQNSLDLLTNSLLLTEDGKASWVAVGSTVLSSSCRQGQQQRQLLPPSISATRVLLGRPSSQKVLIGKRKVLSNYFLELVFSRNPLSYEQLFWGNNTHCSVCEVFTNKKDPSSWLGLLNSYFLCK